MSTLSLIPICFVCINVGFFWICWILLLMFQREGFGVVCTTEDKEVDGLEPIVYYCLGATPDECKSFKFCRDCNNAVKKRLEKSC